MLSPSFFFSFSKLWFVLFCLNGPKWFHPKSNPLPKYKKTFCPLPRDLLVETQVQRILNICHVFLSAQNSMQNAKVGAKEVFLSIPFKKKKEAFLSTIFASFNVVSIVFHFFCFGCNGPYHFCPKLNPLPNLS